jgi:membrane dipeptidase
VTSDRVIDGLLVSKWTRDVYEAMRRGGLEAANCTCSVWEGFEETMRNIAAFKLALREHSDLIAPVCSAEDIAIAASTDRTGVVFGFQNTCALEGKIGYLELFHDVGVRIIQLTYNYQNDVGTGCYEPRDSGLTEFGRDVVAEMNRLGILVDLSHVGEKTSAEAIRSSQKPVAITHAAPAALRDHPRNKSDTLIRAVAESGGVVGLTPLSWFLARGEDSTLEDYLDAFEYTIRVAGEDHVAIGTDITEGHGRAFLEWTMRHRGDGRLRYELAPGATGFPMPAEFSAIEQVSALPDRMRARGWSEERIEKVLRANWLRVFAEVWSGSEREAIAHV